MKGRREVSSPPLPMATLQLYPAAHPAAPPSPQLSPSPPSPPSLRAFSLTEVGGDVTRIPDLLRSYTCKRRLNRNISNGEQSTSQSDLSEASES